jgi:hypothetical protein
MILEYGQCFYGQTGMTSVTILQIAAFMLGIFFSFTFYLLYKNLSILKHDN